MRAMMQKNRKRRAKDEHARGKWVPGQKGQSGEGLRDGYGGTAGEGTDAAGPEGGKRSKPENDAAREEKIDRDADYSPSLPSRDKIAKVLR